MFQAGDFVSIETKTGAVKTKPSKILCCDSTGIIDTRGYEYGFEYYNITLWQPKRGEWCWQYPSTATKENGIPPNLVRYSHYYEGLLCEPFIGELPSFLKDK